MKIRDFAANILYVVREGGINKLGSPAHTFKCLKAAYDEALRLGLDLPERSRGLDSERIAMIWHKRGITCFQDGSGFTICIPRARVARIAFQHSVKDPQERWILQRAAEAFLRMHTQKQVDSELVAVVVGDSLDEVWA